MLFRRALCVSILAVAASTNCSKKEDEPSGWCSHGCAKQFGGGGDDYKCSCNLKCSGTCTAPSVFGRWCDQYGNCTNGCTDGYYDGVSPGCQLKCPNHCKDVQHQGCNKKTGRCNHGCEHGYGGDGDDYDSSCAFKCPDNCKAPNVFGRWCEATSTTWRDRQYNCTNGCIDGYYDGIFIGCQLKCPNHCKDVQHLGCDRNTGRCHHGCEHGYGGNGDDYDSDCSFKCPDNCKAPSVFGRWCDATGKCVNGVQVGANQTKAEETLLVV